MKIIKVFVWPWLYVTAFASTETDVTQTEYLLHTPENPDVADVLPHDASSLGNFNPARRTFVLMHGLGGDGADWPSGKGFNEAFNSAGSFNLIYVNWESLASDPLYAQEILHSLRLAFKQGSELFPL